MQAQHPNSRGELKEMLDDLLEKMEGAEGIGRQYLIAVMEVLRARDSDVG